MSNPPLWDLWRNDEDFRAWLQATIQAHLRERVALAWRPDLRAVGAIGTYDYQGAGRGWRISLADDLTRREACEVALHEVAHIRAGDTPRKVTTLDPRRRVAAARYKQASSPGRYGEMEQRADAYAARELAKIEGALALACEVYRCLVAALEVK